VRRPALGPHRSHSPTPAVGAGRRALGGRQRARARRNTCLQRSFGNYLDAILPFGKIILTVLNVLLLLISCLFAAIYKVLPDRDLQWSDVVVGAVATAILFTIGKSLISWYIGSSAVASSFGAAGALIVLLLWVYYSAQIFLLGAEFTKVYAATRGSMRGDTRGGRFGERDL
jgi:membrane protein